MLTAVACLLCLPWVACQPEGNSTPSPYNLASFHGSFIPMDDLNPPAPQQSFGSKTTYWMKAGEQLKLEWGTYNVDMQCKDNGDTASQAQFAFNLCSTVSGCQAMTGARGASCILENGG